MRISEDGADGILSWKSRDADGRTWFQGEFELPGLSYIRGNDDAIGRRLQQIMEAIFTLNPTFLLTQSALSVETRLEFPRLWGLGSSSTLIYLMAKWAEADPFELLRNTFGGSGYDVAAAGQNAPFLFRAGSPPQIQPCTFIPPFADQLYFVYLGKKQDSRAGIARYRERQPIDKRLIEQAGSFANRALACSSLTEWNELVREHERLVGDLLELPRARDLHFPSFHGEIKSLGAWGGDFVLASSNRGENETRQWFNERGFSVFLPYREMILANI